ncbi:MAG: hypothetical protein ACLP8A_06820 [Methylovirgula sp.]
MNRFIADENIRRYRQLANEATSEAERSKLLALLAEEEIKVAALDRLCGKAACKGPSDRSAQPVTADKSL